VHCIISYRNILSQPYSIWRLTPITTSDCLFGQFERILWISDSEAGVKVEKTRGVVEGEDRYGYDVVALLVRDG